MKSAGLRWCSGTGSAPGHVELQDQLDEGRVPGFRRTTRRMVEGRRYLGLDVLARIRAVPDSTGSAEEMIATETIPALGA